VEEEVFTAYLVVSSYQAVASSVEASSQAVEEGHRTVVGPAMRV